MPLNRIFRKFTNGYKLSKSQENITHLMYMDDIKMFAKNEKRIGNSNIGSENIQSGHWDGIWQRKMGYAYNNNNNNNYYYYYYYYLKYMKISHRHPVAGFAVTREGPTPLYTYIYLKCF